MAIMYTFNDLKEKVKKYFKFSKEEIKALIITILAYAFIISLVTMIVVSLLTKKTAVKILDETQTGWYISKQ